MAASKKQQSALNRRRDELLAKYSSSIEALAGIDVARSALDEIAERRKQAEEKALEKIRSRYDTKESAARKDLAHQLALAREVMSAREVTSETGLTASEQKKFLELAQDNDTSETVSNHSDETDDEHSGSHSMPTGYDNTDTSHAQSFSESAPGQIADD